VIMGPDTTVPAGWELAVFDERTSHGAPTSSRFRGLMSKSRRRENGQAVARIYILHEYEAGNAEFPPVTLGAFSTLEPPEVARAMRVVELHERNGVIYGERTKDDDAGTWTIDLGIETETLYLGAEARDGLR
jgi:hypothetical protein